MNNWVGFRDVWMAVAVLTALDMVLLSKVNVFLRRMSDFRCGTGAIQAANEVFFYSGLSLPFVILIVYRYFDMRREMTPATKFAIRFPITLFVGLALSFFFVPVIARLF